MTFDPKPLLKGFGAAANVAGQIATDKAVNSRRTRSNTFDINAGELLEDVSVANGGNEVPHSLGRVPKGALIIKSPAGAAYNCIGTSLNTVTINTNFAGTISLWVV